MNAHSITKPDFETASVSELLTYSEADVQQWLDDGRYDSAFIDYRSTPAIVTLRYPWNSQWLPGKPCTVAINVPLCAFCENPVDANVCHGCEVVYLDAPTPLRPVPMFNPDDDRFHAVPIATGVAR